MGRRSETPSATEENDEVPTTGRTQRASSKRKSMKEADEESEEEVATTSRKKKPVEDDKEEEADKNDESPEADAEEPADEATAAEPSSSRKKRKSGGKSQPKGDSDESENEENEKPVRKKSGRKKKTATAYDEEQEYEVEKIVDDRAIKGRIQYKIRWKGYQSEDDTWENESTLDCNELIEEYNDAKGDEARANGSSVSAAPKTSKSRGRPPQSDANAAKKQKPTRSANKGGRDAKYAQNAPDPNGEWEVSKLLDMHTLKNGKREFLVRWKGYPPEDDSWEPEEHLKGTDILERFLKKVEEARESSEKELRVRRKPTNFYTPVLQGRQGTRISKRFANKERAKYYDAE